jgi:hypothetical protein
MSEGQLILRLRRADPHDKSRPFCAFVAPKRSYVRNVRVNSA